MHQVSEERRPWFPCSGLYHVARSGITETEWDPPLHSTSVILKWKVWLASECKPLRTATCSCFPRCGLSLPTMTLHSTKDPLSLFQDGKLKPGIYKIKNVLTQTFVDIEEHSRRVCSRPSKDLEEGNGLVGLIPLPLICVSDDHKWEIKPLLAGYTVKRVNLRLGPFLSRPFCVN